MAYMPQSVQDVQKAVENMVEEVQRTVLMPRQKDAFLCCAKCCDAVGAVRDLEHCVQRCSQPSAEAQKIIQTQLGDFQERFQRTAFKCQDEVKDMMPYDATPADQARAQDKFHSCMEASGKDFLKKVPKLKQDIMAALKRI